MSNYDPNQLTYHPGPGYGPYSDPHRQNYPLVSDLAMYPGNGLPPRPGENRPYLSSWGRLCRQGALGKKSNILYNEANPNEQGGPDILQVRGDDMDAQQLIVTLLPPEVIAQPFTRTLIGRDVQNLSGSKDNAQIGSGVFPGTLPPAPIQWPPLIAKIQWGIGGTMASDVEVDFVNGTTVSCVASYIRVNPAVPANTGFRGTSAVYTLSAFVGPGYPKQSTARRTHFTGVVAPNTDSIVLPVPKLATSATVIGMDDTATPGTQVTVATLRFWASPNGTNNVGNFVVTGTQATSFGVPPSAMYATVANLMPLPTRFAIQYNLGI